MTTELSGRDARRILWGSVCAGVAIAGGTAVAAIMVEHAVARLISLVGLYLLGIAALTLVFWALRVSRDGGPGQGPKPPRLVVAAYGFHTLAFLVAAIILVIAALTAWLSGAELAPSLLQAFVLTLFGFIAVRIFADCILNLIYAFRSQAGRSAP